MDWPPYKNEQMHTGSKDSQVVLVTLWTPPEEILSDITLKDYALVAPMYSRKRGISPVIRSLLANKNIRHVIIAGQDLDEGGVALKSFFAHGINKHTIVNTDVEIEKEIPVKAIKELIENVTLYDLRDEQGQSRKRIQLLTQSLEKLPKYGKNETFPEPKLQPPLTMPGTSGGYHIVGNTLLEGYVKLCQTALRFGEVKRHLDDTVSKDLHNILITINSITYDSNLPFSKKEGEQYQKQIANAASIGTLYNYGKRIHKYFEHDQLKRVLESFKKNPYTRKGIINLFDPFKDHDQKHRPGVIYVDIALIDHEIVLTVHLNCMELSQGIAQSMFGFRKIQEQVAETTGFPIGPMHTFVNCGYTSSTNTNTLKKVVDKHKELLQGVNHDDARGNLIISIKEGQIIVQHVSKDHKHLAEWKGKSAKGIYRKLAAESVLLDDYHKFDIGAELQKAEIAIKLGKPYSQDKTWK